MIQRKKDKLRVPTTGRSDTFGRDGGICGSVTISIAGEIAAGDARALTSAINRATGAGYPVKEITLNSVGGNSV